jgi:Vitamin K-dependent gamma-carboxylase
MRSFKSNGARSRVKQSAAPPAWSRFGSRLVGAWNRFFFEPIPANSLGLFRIAYSCVLLATLAQLAPDALVWYGSQGVLSLDNAASVLQGTRLNLFYVLPETNAVVIGFFIFFAMAAVSLLVGFRTRVASVIVWACLVSLHHRNVYVLNAGDHLLRTLSFFLMFAPAGKAYSVDRWLAIRRGASPDVPLIPAWSQRLLQIQVCVMYLDSVAWKLTGKEWIDGTAVYYITHLDEFRRFAVPAFFATLWFSRVATWGALAVEFAMGTLVWIRPIRRYVLLSGVLLHLGLEYSMNIPFFQWAVLATYVLFLDDLKWDRHRKRDRALAVETTARPSLSDAGRRRSLTRSGAEELDRRPVLVGESQSQTRAGAGREPLRAAAETRAL